MLGRAAILILNVLVVALAIGCASPPDRKLSTAPARFATLPNGHDPLNPERLSPLYDLTGTGVEGSAVIKTSDDGVISERLAYFRTPWPLRP